MTTTDTDLHEQNVSDTIESLLDTLSDARKMSVLTRLAAVIMVDGGFTKDNFISGCGVAYDLVSRSMKERAS